MLFGLFLSVHILSLRTLCYCIMQKSVRDKHLKHDAARAAFLDWLAAGEPKFGYYFELMKKLELGYV